jgi:alkanesulfonate monooxygenase SsuD/methylene tetrahydromethanopterin reductase-like flavin-dependent oxidoreductase (luciferase family)
VDFSPFGWNFWRCVLLSQNVKFGVDASLESYQAKTWDQYQDFVKTIDEKTWDSIWLGDHLGALPPISPYRNYNIWPLLGTFAQFKKKVTFGTSVTDPHRYHPAVMAQLAVTLDHLMNGRFILGLGVGEAFNLENYGFEYKNKPVSKLAEFIEVLRKLWNSKGRKVTHEGTNFKLKDAILQPSPIQPIIPIWIASNGKVTRKLTGRIADGWLPYSFNTEMYKAEANEVKQSLTANGRDPANFTFGYWNWIFLHDEEKTLNSYLIERKASLAIQYPHTLKALGFWKEENRELYGKLGFNPDTLSQLAYTTLDSLDLAIVGKIVEDVPDKVVRDATLMGSKEELTKKLESFIKIGVQHFVLMINNPLRPKPDPYSWQHAFQVLSEEIIPHLRENY